MATKKKKLTRAQYEGKLGFHVPIWKVIILYFGQLTAPSRQTIDTNFVYNPETSEFDIGIEELRGVKNTRELDLIVQLMDAHNCVRIILHF